jgi:hypothetical protein
MESHCSLMMCFWMAFDRTFVESYSLISPTFQQSIDHSLNRTVLISRNITSDTREGCVRGGQCSKSPKSRSGRCDVGPLP